MRRILNLFSIYSWVCNELAQVAATKPRIISSLMAYMAKPQLYHPSQWGQSRWRGEGRSQPKMHRCICLICLVIAHRADKQTHSHIHIHTDTHLHSELKFFEYLNGFLCKRNRKRSWKEHREGNYIQSNIYLKDICDISALYISLIK